MQPFSKRDRHALLETWRASWKFLMFGVAMLAYLAAIERPQWFLLRPATGTAVAMARAANAPATPNAGPQSAKP